MKFIIRHEIRGRMRVYFPQARWSSREADLLQQSLEGSELVRQVRVNERLMTVTLLYSGSREAALALLSGCRISELTGETEEDEAEESALSTVRLKNAPSSRALNRHYWEAIVSRVAGNYAKKLFLPMPLQAALAVWNGSRYICAGLRQLRRRKLGVEVLDATAITVSLLRRDFPTAASIMFMLGIGELLEEWTHKKSVGDLARSLSLNVSRVWRVEDGADVLVATSAIRSGDKVRVHMGNVIPFDGEVLEGEAMVNQASMTGESIAVAKRPGQSVYAGTVLEEGELLLQVRQINGGSRYEKIVQMIENSERLKSRVEGRAGHLADRLVPYTLAGTVLTYLLTRNVTRALSVLMVDFSCALKLAIPITVLSAIREASQHGITVKGGRFLENISEADTLVFDKTGTLTLAQPTLVKIVPFNGKSEDEILKLAACMEEHFPHSMARAVVEAAESRGIEHQEMHTKVEYIVAHGISTTINGKRAVIGSRHFIFEDEKVQIPEGKEALFETISPAYSQLYLAIEGYLAGVLCIEDPLRSEAAEVMRALKKLGVSRLEMMTGDNEHTAAAIAARVGVDGYQAEVLPEDKAAFIEAQKAQGRKVVMIGDGINDSPALSAADVGIAVSDGAELAREIADVTIAADNLWELVTLKRLSNALMRRIQQRYVQIVGFNSALLLLGVLGILPPTGAALLHNSSTLYLSLQSTQNLLESQPETDEIQKSRA